MNMNTKSKKLVISGLLIAIGVILPMFFHAVGMAGQIFLPMHIPVLLCGLICGWQYGAIIGVIVPLLSSLLTGMPVLFPMAMFMAFELCAYGLVSGLLAKKTNTIIALVVAMLSGRVVNAIVQVIFFGMTGKSFVLGAFLTSSFVTSLPGIVVQIVLIPVIMTLLKKTKAITVEIK